MPISNEDKKKYVEQFGKDSNDTGHLKFRLRYLTHRIRELTEHVKLHKKDHHTRRGFVMLVAKRKKMMKYLMRSNSESYVKLIKELSIRG